MLRMLRASTPVESFCDVVRIVGIDFSLSWKSRRCCSPDSAVVGSNAMAVVGVFAGFHLIDEVANGEGVVLRRAEDERFFALVDLLHEEFDAVGFAFLDFDDLLKSASS